MIAVDTNVLVYAHRPELPDHEAAWAALKRLAESGDPWGIPLHCLVEFAGVVSHARLWSEPSPPATVIDQVSAWLEAPGVRLLAEEPDWWPVFAAVLAESRAAGGAVHDARIAACCRYHGVGELWSTDRDFGRYPWLRVRNPIVST